MPQDADDARVHELANEELFGVLDALARRRRQRMADIKEKEIDAIRLFLTETSLNLMYCAGVMAREHGRHERDTQATDVIALQHAAAGAARIAGAVLGEAARRQRDPNKRVTAPGSTPAPKGSFSSRPPRAPRQSWEHEGERKTPTFAEQLDRQAQKRERSRRRKI